MVASVYESYEARSIDMPFETLILFIENSNSYVSLLMKTKSILRECDTVYREFELSCLSFNENKIDFA